VKRREFLRTTALSAAALAVARLGRSADTPEHLQAASSSNAPALLRRRYGRKGEEQLSIIGFSGLMLDGMTQPDVNRLTADAVEKGVNYVDVAPAYGKAEIVLGPALEPYRKKVFLACKTKGRTREAAKADFERSCERLRTDHFELYQLHHVYSVPRDLDPCFQKGGAMEFLEELKKEGRIRYIGFSAHSEEAALAALGRYPFDSFLLPLNFASMLKLGFGPKVLAKAKEVGATPIALKAFVRQKQQPEGDPIRKKYPRIWYQPLDDPHEQEMALRFSLGLPIMAAMPPMDARLWRAALDIAMRFKPLTDEEQSELKQLAMQLDPLFPRQE
jgi:hypothetical protein